MDPQPPDDWRQQRADAMRHVFAAARFPVYGLTAWEGERSWAGHGEGVRGVHDIELAHTGRGSVIVETSAEKHPESDERRLERALEPLATPPLPDEAWQRLSPAALTVLMEQHELHAGERVAAVVMHELTIAVDGRPRRFLAGRCGDGWAAIATLGDRPALTVTITADQISPEAIALERIRNIEPYLESPSG